MPEPIEDDLFQESTMTFGEHLEELRACLFKAILGLTAGFIIGLFIGDWVVGFIQRPLYNALSKYYQNETIERFGDDPRTQDRVEKQQLLADEYWMDPAELYRAMQTVAPDRFPALPQPPTASKSPPPTQAEKPDDLVRVLLWHPRKNDPRLQSKSLGTTEPFSVYIKASLLVGIILSSPWVFYQIWHFVAAGLYPHERGYVKKYLPISLGLFLAGAAMAFFAVFEPVLGFLLRFNRSMGIAPEPRINEWLSFVLMLPVGFGIGFQLPLVMLFLERIGVFTVQNYLSQWRIAVLVIFVASAILTPPEPVSMIMMAFPLTMLFFGGVWLCKLMPRRKSPFGETAGR